jgi:lysophospholipase L1-like esterase
VISCPMFATVGLVAPALAFVVGACTGSAGSTASTIPTVVMSPTASATPAASADPLRLVILGDSIAVPEVGCGGCVGFDEQYAAYLETQTSRAVDVHNEAVPGDRIESLKSLLDANVAVQSAIANADIVVVSIGYNNGPPWDPDDPCHVQEVARDADLIPAILDMTPECITETIDKYRGELDAVYGRIEALAAGRPQVRVTFGVFDNIRDNPGADGTLPQVTPEDMQPALDLFVSIFDRWNAMDCEVAVAHGFVCADLRHAFNGPDGNGSVGPYTAPDWVHPNEAGQAVMAKLLQRVDVSAVVRP